MFKIKNYLLLFIIIPSILFIIIGKDKDINRVKESPVLNPANPASEFIDGETEQLGQSTNLTSNPVPAQLIPKQGRSDTSLETKAMAKTIKSYEVPTPKKRKIRSKYIGIDPTQPSQNSSVTGNEIRALQSTITAGGTVTNVNNTGGSLFIPADPHGAAGPNHVVNVFNVSIEFYQKDGTQDFSDDLQAFFSALSPANFTFDPKVIYDQYEDRWVVVTLERVDSGSGAASDTSLVLVAVSDDSNPNGTWTVTEINTKIDIDTAAVPPAVLLPHWLDYPGLGVDDEAIYITGNMFRFLDGSATSGNFGGNRVIIIDKGVSGGFYAGGAASFSIFDQNAEAGSTFELTAMPAQIYGNPGGTIGSWLVSYSGLSNGNEAVELIRIDNPLAATPTFTQQLFFMGDVDNTAAGVPDAPQSGGITPVDTGDRRILDAVWRDGSVYYTTLVVPSSGVDAGEATAFWGQASTSGAPSFIQGGTIGGDIDIGTDTYTSYASIAVNNDGGIMVGFSASSSSTFPSSYFVNRSPTDPTGSMRPATLIRAGQAGYVRTFGSSNRWGDYSATSVDPDEECFWSYNKYATTQGTPTGSEVGRYLTAHAQFCNDNPVAVADSATVDNAGTITMVNGTETSLIANDSDVDEPDDTLSMNTSAVSGPNSGSVTLNSNGTFSYTHNGTATLTDDFVYRVCDDGSPSKCADGTVNITVGALGNQPPVAADDSFSVDEGNTTNTLNGGSNTVLNNDTDVDDVNLTVTVNSGPANASAFSLNTNGTFSYTHDGTETPTSDSFDYNVCDDEAPTPACDIGTVTITINPVNDAPTAGDDAFTVNEAGTTTTLTGGSSTVLNNDTDVDDVNLTVTVNSGPANASAFSLNTNGTFSYTHDGTETPISDSFVYNVCDDEGTPACDTGTVTITINPVNDAPVANNDAITVFKGGIVSVLNSGSNTVLNNDTDADDATLTASISTPPANASAFILNDDGTFSYTHNNGISTSDSFIYQACDDETPTNACTSAIVDISILNNDIFADGFED